MIKYVTVICAPRRSYSGSGRGDWSCFVGDDKDEVIKQALSARRAFGTRDYQVLIGVLTDEVTVPVTYKLKPIKTECGCPTKDGCGCST